MPNPRKKPLAPRPPKPPPLTPVQKLWGMRVMLENAAKQVLYLEQEMNESPEGTEPRPVHATIALKATLRALESIEVTVPLLRKIVREVEYDKSTTGL
jgi:hypothetical protein